MNAAVSRAAGRKYLRNPYFVSEEKALGTPLNRTVKGKQNYDLSH